MKKDNNMPVNMALAPRKPSWYLKMVQWAMMLGFSSVFASNTKVAKHGFKNFNTPTLVISNHASFTDFSNLDKLMFPKVPAYVVSIEEMIGREWLMRHIGCFPKRKFTSDFFIPKHFNTALNKNHNSIGLFPEARFSFCGVNERIDGSLGKLAKLCQCQVVVCIQKGNFLKSPQWDKHPYRKVRNYIDAYLICTKEESKTLSADEIQKRIEDKFVYDEYKWQADNKIKITCKKRAENIHRILYKCPVCNTEGQMSSKLSSLKCECCNTVWNMDEYGLMHQENGEARFPLVSDWYRWERDEVYKEVESGTYVYEDEVRLSHLVNSKVGLKPIGKVHFRQDDTGIHVEGDLDNGEHFVLHKNPESQPSLHIEFDLREQGAAIDVNTIKDTWFAFPESKASTIMKLNFATEALYDKHYK